MPLMPLQPPGHFFHYAFVMIITLSLFAIMPPPCYYAIIAITLIRAMLRAPRTIMREAA